MQQLAECRVYERHSCQVPASCQPAASNEMRWPGVIEDISQSGIRLRLRRRLEPRSGLAIVLPGKDDQEPETIYVRVVHVRSDSDGTYLLGCKFMSDLSEEEVQRLLSVNASSGPELNHSMPAEPAPAYAVPEEEDAPSPPASNGRTGTIVPSVRLWIDVRAGEVIRCRVKRFHAPGHWPPVPGKKLNLRGVARNGARLQHQFQVVDCCPHGDDWLLQVRTVDASAAGDLLKAFGR